MQWFVAEEDLDGVQAIADRFGVKMYIVTSYREGDIIEINPNGPLRSERVLYLSFWAEVTISGQSQPLGSLRLCPLAWPKLEPLCARGHSGS